MKTREARKLAVTIAKDVIASIKANKISVTPGHYCEIPGIGASIRAESINLKQHLKALAKKKKPCSACALGSMFLAKVDRFNKCEIPTSIDSFNAALDSDEDYTFDILTQLRDAFSDEELCYIEMAFETDPDVGISYNYLDLEYEWIDDNKVYNDNKINKSLDFTKGLGINERLIKIMENIIANNGEFKP